MSDPAARPLRSDSALPAWALATCGVLAVVNIARTMHHAMWRDEMQAFLIALNSATPLELFHHLKYEGHPGLWHAILWLVTRFTADPVAMQVVQIIIALGVWTLVVRFAPFSPIEKILLLLSHALFFEYFVLSRGYALMPLLGFGFIALRAARPQAHVAQGLLLGLLANTIVFGTIWSLALAAWAAWTNERSRAELAGAAIYVALLALAVATMIPAPDVNIYQPSPTVTAINLGYGVRFVIGAFIPLQRPWLNDLIALAGIRNTEIGGSTEIAWMLAPIEIPMTASQLAIALVVLIWPALVCWRIVRDRVPLVQFLLGYAGPLAFATLWKFKGDIRHHEIVFLVFVGAIWTARAGAKPAHAPWLWRGVLAVSALCGLLTLASVLRPFSNSENVAAWLQRERLADRFLLATRDSAATAISGYLGRPIYYLDCECRGTFVVWNRARDFNLGHDEALRRVARALREAGQREAILISSVFGFQPYEPGEPALAFEMIGRFIGSAMSSEDFFVYRVTIR